MSFRAPDLPKSSATESISFRLEEDVLVELREISKERKVSLNSLVSQILEHYLTLGVYDRTFGFFSVSSDILRLVLAQVPEDEIKKIADTSRCNDSQTNSDVLIR